MDFTNVNEVLMWLVGGGSVILLNWFASWVLERADWWHTLAAGLKQAIILVFAGLIGAGAQWLLLHPDVWAGFEPYITALLLAIGGWLSSQRAHIEDPERKRSY